MPPILLPHPSSPGALWASPVRWEKAHTKPVVGAQLSPGGLSLRAGTFSDKSWGFLRSLHRFKGGEGPFSPAGTNSPPPPGISSSSRLSLSGLTNTQAALSGWHWSRLQTGPCPGTATGVTGLCPISRPILSVFSAVGQRHHMAADVQGHTFLVGSLNPVSSRPQSGVPPKWKDWGSHTLSLGPSSLSLQPPWSVLSTPFLPQGPV